MIKKIITSTVVAGALTFSSLAAAAAPIAFESADRAGSPVAGAEALGGELSEAWLILLFGAAAAGIILLILQKKNVTLPVSP